MMFILFVMFVLYVRITCACVVLFLFCKALGSVACDG